MEQPASHYGLSDAAMLQTLTLQNAPRAAVHGTSARNFESIRVDGLHRGQRQHIHFITGEAAEGARTQDKETSGLRAGSEVMLWIDVHKCLRAPNDVLLSPGQEVQFRVVGRRI